MIISKSLFFFFLFFFSFFFFFFLKKKKKKKKKKVVNDYLVMCIQGMKTMVPVNRQIIVSLIRK